MKFALAAVVALLGSATAASAGFVNTTATLQVFYPNLSTPYLGPVTKVVGAGVEFPSASSGLFTVDVSDTGFTLTTLLAGVFEPTPFNGFRLTFANLTTPITGLSVNPGGTLAGFNASRLSFTANTITVNLAGQQISNGLSVGVTAAVGPAVAPLPVPLLAGVGLLGGTGLLRRRRTA